MNGDLESTPLIESSETSTAPVVESSSFFGKRTRTAAAVSALLSLSVMAVYFYTPTEQFMSATTNLQIWDIQDDLAFCPNNFIYGVTPRTASRGCVVISKDDLFDPIAETGISMSAAHLCVGSSDTDGLLKVDFDMIKDMGLFYDDTTGYHSISGIAPGQDVDVQVFSGKNFDGKMATINANEDGRLPGKFYADGTSANDNVGSFIVVSRADHFFAGKKCGLHQQVCPMVITAEQALMEPLPGCMVLTTRDPTSLVPSAQTTAVRVCADSESYILNIDKLALTAMGVIWNDSGRKSQISYLKKGQSVSAVYYKEDTPGTGPHLVGAGSLTGKKYSDGTKVNDNIYSMTMNAGASEIPKSCDIMEGH